MRLARHVTLPIADAVTFNDLLNRKIDLDLKKSLFTAARGVCRPAIALVAVGRAITSWTSNVAKLLLEAADQEKIVSALQELNFHGKLCDRSISGYNKIISKSHVEEERCS